MSDQRLPFSHDEIAPHAHQIWEAERKPEGKIENGAIQSRSAAKADKPCYDLIALKAYFIALDRHARGEPSDPFKDWLEAEKQLLS
jgi:hypothetical protein